LFRVSLDVLPGRVWVFVAFSGFVHALYIISISRAYVRGDLSYVYPIARSAPAFVPIASFIIFGERISLQGAIGIIIVVICVFLLQFREKIVEESKHLFTFVRQRESLWAFATMATVVIYTLIDKAGMTALSQVERIRPSLQGLLFFFLQASLSNMIYWGYMGVRRQVGNVFIWKREWLRAILAALATIGSYSLILHVMKTEILGYIVTLRQTSVLIAVLVGWIIFEEKYGRLRLTVATVMFIGLFLVATAK
jgi:uncharacterized membrane protein